MSLLNKVLQGMVVTYLSMGVTHAATRFVTNERSDGPGGFYDVLASAEAGDTIKFDVGNSFYDAFTDDSVIIDKPLHIDASNLSFGLHFQVITHGLDLANIQINTGGDERPVRFTNVNFDGIENATALLVKNSNFVCSYCYFVDNLGGLGPAVVSSENANIAFLNTLFFNNRSLSGTLYRGTGDLFLVNSRVEFNYVESNQDALFQGTEGDQLFYVRNSTITRNLGQAFGMNSAADSRSRLDIRHSIVTQNTETVLNIPYDIRANLISSGYNIFGKLDYSTKVKTKHSDVFSTNLLEVFVDIDSDGEIFNNDYFFPVEGHGFSSWPSYDLLSNGIALNRGDPLFTPYEVLRDFRKIPHVFLGPIIESLRNGDFYGRERDRKAAGRIDIGAYEAQ